MKQFNLVVAGALLLAAIPITIHAATVKPEKTFTVEQVEQMAIAAGTHETFMPDNWLHYRTGLEPSLIGQGDFNQTIDEVIELYEPIVNSHGATLTVHRLWDNNTVNANAYQAGNSWNVRMYGGLARAPEVTPDGFAMVVCHEMGHHLAGYPFYDGVNAWAGSEGQSDYFASQSCARQLWMFDDNSAFEADVHPQAKKQCDNEWDATGERQLCYRVSLAGQSLGDLLAALRGQTVSYDRKDNNKVSKTQKSHPQPQCRLDTYLAGALCNVTFNPFLIPGKDQHIDRESLYAEQEAGLFSCARVSHDLNVPNINDAYRPRCWYKPRLTSNGIPIP